MFPIMPTCGFAAPFIRQDEGFNRLPSDDNCLSLKFSDLVAGLVSPNANILDRISLEFDTADILTLSNNIQVFLDLNSTITKNYQIEIVKAATSPRLTAKSIQTILEFFQIFSDIENLTISSKELAATFVERFETNVNFLEIFELIKNFKFLRSFNLKFQNFNSSFANIQDTLRHHPIQYTFETQNERLTVKPVEEKMEPSAKRQKKDEEDF
jgi:glutaredoxin-related protein